MKLARQGNRAATLAALLVLATAHVTAVPWIGQRALAAQPATAPAAQEERLELVTASGVHALDVEIASTPEKQALGLMYRTSLPDTKGMLFPHQKPAELSMWMRNTYIPLDMVFITADGTVHRIEARTEPFSERIISSNGPVAAVLEIAGGAAERMGLKPGDKVRHPHFGSAPAN
ncbi:DUF192 domain-containing protein [Hyphomicrobium sp.]|uniref:DUF192 domain-containing protein n=1 Tax=Hyphomicrobium sp. TaxID=82 RepID=UPI002E338CBF|nr:DUF192 domain-containing protein [Hyphomicrobium sp.]HEX2841086.1 DUF192 domain-containing protein [Hyphomicrobium sp.]